MNARLDWRPAEVFTEGCIRLEMLTATAPDGTVLRSFRLCRVAKATGKVSSYVRLQDFRDIRVAFGKAERYALGRGWC
jgi:hypothetical protein